MPADVLERVVELCAERGAWLFCDEVYRELEHDPADRLPAACDLYERALSLGSMSKTYGLPGLRLGWLASRDRDALAQSRRPQALHDDLLECPERAAQRARAEAPRSARRPQPRDRAREPAARRRVPRACSRSISRGSGRRPARSASPDCTASRTRPPSASGSSPRPACSCCPGAVYDEPEHVRIGFGRSNMPEALAAVRGLDRHAFLTRAIMRAQLMRKLSEQPADTPCSRRPTPSRRGAAMGDGQRLTTWIEWYRFARRRARAGTCGGVVVCHRPVRRGAESRRSSVSWRAA